MKLNNLSNKQQLFLGIAITVSIAAIYVLFRVMPSIEFTQALENEYKDTQNKITKKRVKNAPKEDSNSLLAQIQDQEQAMELIKENASNIETRLAAFDSQELKVRISQLANKSRVRIKTNQAVKSFPIPQNRLLPKKKKKAAALSSKTEALVIPASQGWLARMAPATMLHRPMQRLNIEGSYQHIQEFIYGLDNLPWQVTVIQLNIKKMPTSSPVGLPQLLSANLVLAL